MVKSHDDIVLEEATRRLVCELKPTSVYLFGSRARGTASPDSDFDFFVVVPSGGERSLRRAQRAYRALRGLGISKDVVVTTVDRFDRFKGLQASLEYEVATQGRLLYG
ncbi:MAG: nucleotidyltransferase domain-containing protein [Actinomycetota bacterium]|nr:nucleotidyltransferase domain-containing protein [Actinomycetota bacterium]